MPSDLSESVRIPVSPGHPDHPETKGRVKKLTGFWETLNKKVPDKGSSGVIKRTAGGGQTCDETNTLKKSRFVIEKKSEKLARDPVPEDVQISETETSDGSRRSETTLDQMSEIILMPQELFDRLISIMTSAQENEQKCRILEREKKSYLFSSNHLFQILDLTPSVKTRISMILILAPRLTDPKSNSLKLLDMFRFSEDKQQVQEALRQRSRALESKSFTTFKPEASLSIGKSSNGQQSLFMRSNRPMGMGMRVSQNHNESASDRITFQESAPAP